MSDVTGRIEHGQKMYELADKLFPICRSITGAGVRETLAILSDYIAESDGVGFDIHEIPSGTKVFDWVVPKEWVIRSAYIEDENQNRIIDMANNNLHVMGYSVAVDKWVDLEELKAHIYTEPDQPDAIPYVTSYYKDNFGFCMSENMKNSLPQGKYHMVIDSEHIDGSLTYAELIIPGKCEKEIFFSTYVCHPSMADNECSGPSLMAEIIRYVKAMKDRRYTYRFAIVTETIGSITYLATGDRLSKMQKNVIAGFNLSCVGDDKGYSLIPSRYGNTLADKALRNILKYHTDDTYTKYTYRDRGSDERQYTSPGVDLPVVCFCRSKFGNFPEYHTSADNMDFVSPEGFEGSFTVMTELIEALENNYYYRMKVLCEPQLGKRGLYSNISRKGIYDGILVQRDFISYSDGTNDLFDISDWADAPVSELIPIATKLYNADLIERN